MMRQRFLAEIEAVNAGRDPKGIIRDAARAQSITLPDMGRETNTQGIALEDFLKDPVSRQQLKGFRHLYGQPPEVRRAFEEGMGIAG